MKLSIGDFDTSTLGVKLRSGHKRLKSLPNQVLDFPQRLRLLFPATQKAGSSSGVLQNRFPFQLFVQAWQHHGRPLVGQRADRSASTCHSCRDPWVGRTHQEHVLGLPLSFFFFFFFWFFLSLSLSLLSFFLFLSLFLFLLTSSIIVARDLEDVAVPEAINETDSVVFQVSPSYI